MLSPRNWSEINLYLIIETKRLRTIDTDKERYLSYGGEHTFPNFKPSSKCLYMFSVLQRAPLNQLHHYLEKCIDSGMNGLQ